MTLEDALLYRIKEITHLYYAATGQGNAEFRMEHAEYIANEAEAIAYSARQLRLKIRQELLSGEKARIEKGEKET